MSHKYNLIMNYSNPKNKIIMIKNKRGMNDPAFQSNQTLKEYINKKLTLYKENEINKCPQIQSLLNYNTKDNKKKPNNRNSKNNKNFIFKENSFYSRTMMHNLSNYNNNASLNNLRKNQNKKNEKNNNNNTNNNKTANDFFVFKCSNYNSNNNSNNNNKLSKKKILDKNKKGIINIEEPKTNKFFEIVVTPNNNNKKEDSKTSPINVFNKTKGIYRRKNMLLNKSYKSFSRDLTSFMKKEKEIKYKSPNNKYSTKLKKEINNILIHKPLNKTYFKENTKKPRFYYNNLLDIKNNKNSNNNQNNENKDNFNESLNESECPEPMPYVKKYSDINDKENISQSDINIMNFKINQNLNDLKEPEEEKNVPLPVSQINDNNNNNNKLGNKIFQFNYKNRNNLIKKEI